MKTPSKLKLIYFSVPSRAEGARLLLTMGNIEHEDKRIDREEWAALKPATPFGQVPVLEVDGQQLAQSGAIDRYCAKLAGLYPEDPWQAALSDQAYDVWEDVFRLLGPTFFLPEDQKAAARAKLIQPGEGLAVKMDQITKTIDNLSTEFFAGSQPSYGDLRTFVMLSYFSGGALDGIPKDVLDRWPVLKAFRNKVASFPAVEAFYEKNNDDIRKAYRKDALRE